MLKKMSVLVVLLFTMTFMACGGDSGPDLKEGKWRMTMEMNMPGVPNPMQPMTVTECITKENMVPGQTSGQSGCQMVNTRTSGDTVYWEQTCPGSGTSKGQITYQFDSFEGQVTMDVQGRTMKTIMKGKWIGSCN